VPYVFHASTARFCTSGAEDSDLMPILSIVEKISANQKSNTAVTAKSSAHTEDLDSDFDGDDVRWSKVCIMRTLVDFM